MAYIAYEKYLRSPAWKRKRKTILKRANGLCEQCGNAPPRDVHHRSYAHFGKERNDELMAVCQPCHKALEEAAGGSYGPKPWRKKAVRVRGPRPDGKPKKRRTKDGRRHLDLRYARPETRRKWWRQLTRQFLSGGGVAYPGTLDEFNAKWDALIPR